MNSSSRVQRRETGLPAACASRAASTAHSPVCLPPNPPPKSGTMTRTFSSGMWKASAISLRTPKRVLRARSRRCSCAVRRPLRDGRPRLHRGVLDVGDVVRWLATSSAPRRTTSCVRVVDRLGSRGHVSSDSRSSSSRSRDAAAASHLAVSSIAASACLRQMRRWARRRRRIRCPARRRRRRPPSLWRGRDRRDVSFAPYGRRAEDLRRRACRRE